MNAVVSVHESDAKVGARTDIDGLIPRVTFIPDPHAYKKGDGEELLFDPATARRVARQLNRWAKLVSTK